MADTEGTSTKVDADKEPERTVAATNPAQSSPEKAKMSSAEIAKKHGGVVVTGGKSDDSATATPSVPETASSAVEGSKPSTPPPQAAKGASPGKPKLTSAEIAAKHGLQVSQSEAAGATAKESGLPPPPQSVGMGAPMMRAPSPPEPRGGLGSLSPAAREFCPGGAPGGMSMGYRAAPPAYHQPSSHHQQPYGYQPRGGPGYGGRGGYAPHYPPAQYTQPHQYGGPGYGAEPYRGGYGGAGAGAGAGAGGGEGGLTAEEEAWLLEQEDLLAGEADDSGLTAEDFERMALHAAQTGGLQSP